MKIMEEFRVIFRFFVMIIWSNSFTSSFRRISSQLMFNRHHEVIQVIMNREIAFRLSASPYIPASATFLPAIDDTTGIYEDNNDINLLLDATKRKGKKISYLDRVSMNEALRRLAENQQIFHNLEDFPLKLLKSIAEQGLVYVHEGNGLERFISKIFDVARTTTLSDKTILEVLDLAAELSYTILHLSTKEQDNVKEFISRVNYEYLRSNFNVYCNYLFNSARIRCYLKQDTPREKMLTLLSFLPDFGEVESLPLPAAERLIEAIERMVIFKSYLCDLDDRVKTYYHQLIHRVLYEKYSLKGEFSKTGRTIAYAILKQLKDLAPTQKREKITLYQLQLILNGLNHEWKSLYMNIYTQALTILTLGELNIHYKTISGELWTKMINDMIKKMEKVNAVGLSSMFKGWRGMQYKWRDMDPNLKTSVLDVFSRFCKEGEEDQLIANVLLYLGDLEADWKDEQLQKVKDAILYGLSVASKNFIPQELSNALIGLAHMKVSWEDLGEEVKSALMTAIERNRSQMKTQDVINLIYSLGQMGQKWSDLPNTGLRENMLNLLTQSISSSEFVFIGLNGAMTGLTSMQYSWKENKILSQAIFRKIEYWYGEKEKIVLKEHVDGITGIIYSLGEGKVEWMNLKGSVVQALTNGIEAYCSKILLEVKRVSNLLYGLANLRLSKYDMTDSMRNTLETAVNKIAMLNTSPQATSNIMYSLCKMQFLWSNLKEESRLSLIIMIQNTYNQFTIQNLSNVMYSIAVMVREDDKDNKNLLDLHRLLIERYYEFERNQVSSSQEDQAQQAIYFEWLETLPASKLNPLLEDLKIDRLPMIVNTDISKPSQTHYRFSQGLLKKWSSKVEEGIKANRIPETLRDRLMNIIFLDEFNGLRRKVYPIDISVGYSEGNETKWILFIEIDHEVYHRHRLLSYEKDKEKNELIIDVTDQLKSCLYKYHYQNVPLLRVEVKKIDANIDREINQVIEGLLSIFIAQS